MVVRLATEQAAGSCLTKSQGPACDKQPGGCQGEPLDRAIQSHDFSFLLLHVVGELFHDPLGLANPAETSRV